MPNEEQVPAAAQTSRPIPDPTLLTTQQLWREVAALKEIVFTRLDGMERGFSRQLELVQAVIETRFEANDKAIRILQDISDKFPARIDEKIDSLKQINEGEFQSVQVQFRERDVRTEAAASATKIAVDAALQAAKEAVGEQNRSSALAIAKSEASTDKRIDAIAGLIATTSKAADDKIDDLKSRLNRIEGQAIGKLETKAEVHSSSGVTIAFIGIGLAIISTLIALLRSFGRASLSCCRAVA